MSALRGFGLTFDIERGMARNWYVGTDGVTRWAARHSYELAAALAQQGGEDSHCEWRPTTETHVRQDRIQRAIVEAAAKVGATDGR